MPVIESAITRKKGDVQATEEHRGDAPLVPDKPENSPTPTREGQAVLVPVPPGVPPPVRGTVPRTPKVKRAIRQRQPFDIFEDQYLRLKQIAEAEREFEDGRGMSQMVRQAIDMYLKKEHSRTNE